MDCANRAEQASIFVDNVRAEVLEPLAKTLRQHETHLKTCGNKVAQLENDIRTEAAKSQKSREKYLDSLKEAEESLYNCESFRRNPADFDKSDPQLQEKLNVKMWNALRILQDDFETYKKHGKFTTTFKPLYYGTVAQMAEELQRNEEQRIQVAKDSLQKLLIFEVSMEQNHKYDIKQISDIIEAVDVGKDIQELISTELSKVSPKDSVFKSLQIEPKKSGWDRLFELYRLQYYGKEDQLDYARSIEEVKTYITRCDDKEYKSQLALFRSLASKLLGSAEPPGMPLVKSCEMALSTRKGRLAFIDALKEATAGGRARLTQEGYKLAANVLLYFLDKVNKTAESDQIAASMQIAETLHWNDDKTKESLLFAVKSHDVWRDMGFWQKTLKDELDLELLLQRCKYIRERQQGAAVQLQYREQREKGTVLERLNVFVRQMAKCGVEYRDIKDFAVKNASSYGLTSKQIEELNVLP